MKFKVVEIVPLKKLLLLLFALAVGIFIFVVVPLGIFIPPAYRFIIIDPVFQLCFLSALLYTLKDDFGVNLRACVKAGIQKLRFSFVRAFRYFLLFIAVLFALTALAYPLLSHLCGEGDALAFTKNMAYVHGQFSFAGFLTLVASTCILAPLLEELIFRRLFYVSLRARMGFASSLLISSAVFASVHFSPVTFLYGLYLGYVFEKEQDLSVNIILHSLLNVIVILAKFPKVML